MTFDSRNHPLIEHGSETTLFDEELFFSTHGVGDNPVTERELVLHNLIDPNEPTLQEIRLCKNIIKGMSNIDAYIKAFGYKGDENTRNGFSSACARILKRPRVAIKMYEMRKAMSDFEEEDMLSLITQLNSDRQLARDLGQPSAAISALKLKAQLLGLTEDKKIINNITMNLSDTQKRSLLDRIGSRVSPRNDDIDDAEYEDV
jgi:hypothetical protein